MTVPTSMKAAVLHRPGPPEALVLEDRPIPKPQPGQVLIEVKAFGLNRSEMYTRQGHSPSVKLPRILGIEAVGLVADPGSSAFKAGEIVATAMGGMGRQFDGGYAEYCLVPDGQVQRLKTSLDWSVLGAMPEMLQTAWGSLFIALQLTSADTLLVRGGTTSVGLAAIAIAKRAGATVAATTRRSDRDTLLREHGADRVFIDDGRIADEVVKMFPGGMTKVYELVGTTTLEDSLRCVRRHGIVCMAGMVSNKWSFDTFAPMDAIPTAVNLTTYSGGPGEFMRTPLQDYVDDVAAGKLHIAIGKVFKLDQIVEAHRCMEANEAGGKIVILT